MKKILYFFGITFLFITFVNAKTIQTYYGYSFEEDMYKELIEIYGYNYIYFLNKEEYLYLKNSDLSNVKTITYEDTPVNLISPFSSYSTSYKTISLTNNNGYVTIKLTWKKDPKIRSYDVFAVRLQGLTYGNTISFKQYYTENGTTKVNTNATLKKFSNGFGESFLLSDKSNLECSITFYVNGTGKVYATYQHATSNISLNDSTNYTLSALGLGNVLLFNNRINDKYDKMAGINISI